MSQVFIVGGLDVAELVFYAFFLFFLGLVIYLRREDRREGYPLEEEATGAIIPTGGFLQSARPKSFFLPHGKGVISPDAEPRREPVEIPETVRAHWGGSPLDPVGNPLTAGVGAGAFQSARAHEPELDMHGRPKIVPIGLAEGFRVADGEPDVIGWPVVAADGKVAGTVSDLWVDTTDHLVRYLAVAIPGEVGTNPALLPMTMALVRKGRGEIEMEAVTAAQFAGVPRPQSPTQVTRNEEDRITAYLGAGYLYATPDRVEPWL
ncbi:MAG: photosynthetic reaction center subunit H [Thermaurantiacus tibetensis]|uniref:photosynthetic reaction center subunit H n=1 Tax=Thermaurantiacus tibetensis TaxID=2759035 RepID=UPI0018900D70|nr:photosynthetic reaction center subunit H [Thermaurantiacus tibetensis]